VPLTLLAFFELKDQNQSFSQFDACQGEAILEPSFNKLFHQKFEPFALNYRVNQTIRSLIQLFLLIENCGTSDNNL
jgi:hypothetical protein